MARSASSEGDQISNIAFSVTNTNTSSLTETFSCWVKIPSSQTASYGCVFTLGIAGGIFYRPSVGKLAYYPMSGNHWTGGMVDPGTASVSAGNWYHAAFTYSPTDKIGRAYLSGVSDGTGGPASDNGTDSATGLYCLSDAGAGGSDKLGAGGAVADACYWNVALTALEIAALAAGVRPWKIRPANIVLWWPLDGLVSPEPEFSGNARNGTLSGTALAFGPPFLPITPRRPLNFSYAAGAAAAATFNPAWAFNKEVVVQGIGY